MLRKSRVGLNWFARRGGHPILNKPTREAVQNPSPSCLKPSVHPTKNLFRLAGVSNSSSGFFSALAIALLLAWLLVSSARAGDAAAPPMLTDEEKKAGWKLLFDGVTTNGWRGLGMEGFPSVWVIENGCLRCLGGYKGANDLVTVDKHENFEFSFEWMFPKRSGNSGVKYRVQEKKGQGYAFGPEYQCMNDPEATDKHASGSLYDLFPPVGKKLKPQGEFNQSRIVLRGNHVEHWLNGVKVVEAEFGSEAMNAALAQSHFKNSDWGKNPVGHLILQDHHSEVFFRNLKIRVLPAAGTK